jgi:SNF2 family DNA or RNA helicase
MLPRQPLRFLLADDPGAGKTIMAALLVKELLIRGDPERCLVVAPGNLVEQWQDELAEKFHLEFAILTRDRIEASRTGNPFDATGLWITRLDMLSRNEDLQAKLFAARECSATSRTACRPPTSVARSNTPSATISGSGSPLGLGISS